MLTISICKGYKKEREQFQIVPEAFRTSKRFPLTFLKSHFWYFSFKIKEAQVSGPFSGF